LGDAPEISRLLTPIALAAAALAAAILVGYLVRRPALTGAVKVWLFFGVGVLPICAALTGNIAGYETSKSRAFCASCHTMTAHTRDAADPESASLASFHSRNDRFGGESCYVCHQDYGLFGTVTTKLNGLRHLWVYQTRYAGGREAAPGELALYRPFPNHNCTQCHSMTLPGFRDEPEHGAVAEDLATGAVSCASEGCHGPVHPRAQGAS
jgi:cytochrome c-type protein NapC